MRTDHGAPVAHPIRRTIAGILAMAAASAATVSIALAQEAPAAADAPAEVVEEEAGPVSDIVISAQRARTAIEQPTESSFGFPKSILETPRSVDFVSEEQLRLYGVSTVEDVTRLVPGTYTTTRYGLQGGISVRGVSADFYYRGMRRLQMQGHVRTVLSAYDNIEVVKGPPSPLYGMGQIGGYANLSPKSSRARDGKYDSGTTGYIQLTRDSYNKNEAQFGFGMPFDVGDRAAGLYVVGLLEDSDTFVDNVPAKQKFIQATVSVDNAVGPLRLELGGQMQNSITAGAYFNRVTQELIENGTYIRGRPLANLDFNADGRVGYVESFLGSPVQGAISGNNQALDQRYTIRLANGDPIPIQSLKNSIAGIPQSMKNFLTTGAGATLNCAMANYMRTTAPVAALGTTTAGPIVTRQLPVGFVLDPCTVQKVQLNQGNYRANGAFEREQNATQQMAFMDLVFDTDPNFTIKNQLFYDSLSNFKDSFLPYGENQAIRAIEDKITVTRKVPENWLPGWMEVNSLASINYRETRGYIRSSGGDWDYRQDVLFQSGAGGSGTGGHYANTMFWTQLTNPDYYSGAADTVFRRSKHTETGVGVMLDINFLENTNLMLGGRSDRVKARVNESASFNPNTGNIGTPTAAFIDQYRLGLVCRTPGGSCPGAFLAPTSDVTANDNGSTYSISLSHQLPWGKTRPYITQAKSTITLDGSNNLYARGTVLGAKLVGSADLVEVGVKGQLFSDSVQWTVAAFRQNRTDVSNPTDPSINAFALSTRTEGVEFSVNAQPIKTLSLGASVSYVDPRFTTGLTTGQTLDVNARDLGFQDIVLPTGEVYPAEAFGYGGRLRVLVNDPNNIYDTVPGTPNWQAAANATWSVGRGFGLLANAQYIGDAWANRLQTLEIPGYTVLNAGVTWDSEKTHVRLNVFNALDEINFRGGIGGNPNLLSVMPDRRYELSVKLDF